MAERVYCLYRGKDQESILMQKNACHDFAEKKGWNIVDEEQEIGVSGYGDAARWFQLSADKGYKYAQYSLAGLFRRGQGVEQDDARALELYTASAQQDFP